MRVFACRSASGIGAMQDGGLVGSLCDERLWAGKFRDVDAFIGKGPHVREGSPALNAARIKAPVLLFHGTEDLNVGVGESRFMSDRLRDAGKMVEFVEFKKLHHQGDDITVRATMLAKSDAFLRKAMSMLYKKDGLRNGGPSL